MFSKTLNLGIQESFPKPVVTNTFKFQILLTVNTTAGKTFTIPTNNGGAGFSHNFTVNWGDGSADSVVTVYNDPDRTHVYASIGTYNITLAGSSQCFSFNNINENGSLTKIIKVLTATGNIGFKKFDFYGCTNLTSVSHNIKNLSSLTSATNMFRNCPALKLTLTPGIFDKWTLVTSFANVFDGCSGLTGSIPIDLFRYNTLVTNFSTAFQWCSNLSGSIPADLFKYNVLANNFSVLFQRAGLTGSIPTDLFRYNTSVTTFYYVFRYCTGLTGSIPSDLFRYNTLVTNMQGALAGLNGITGSIPADLFKYNTLVTNFSGLFYDSPGLSAIPTDLFRYNTSVTTFYNTFYHCFGLTDSIPTDLFKYNTAVTTFQGTFDSCTGLTGSIPTDLFKYNTLVTNFQATFNACLALQLNENIFYGVGEQATRFLNKSVNFTNCFYRDTFSGVQGTAPDLWNCNFGTGTPTKTTCYGGAGNSIVSLDNYDDIPIAWK